MATISLLASSCYGQRVTFSAQNVAPSGGGGGTTPVTFVQASTIAGFDPLTHTWHGEFPSATTAGNVVCVSFTYDPTKTVSSVINVQGDTFALGVTNTHDTAQTDKIYCATNITGASAGQSAVTITFNADPSFAFAMLTEYTGQIKTSNAAMFGASSSNGCSSSCGASPITMSSGNAAGVLLHSAVILMEHTNAGTDAISSPWNTRSGAPSSFGVGDQTNVSAGTYNGAGTDTGTANDDWGMAILELKG